MAAGAELTVHKWRVEFEVLLALLAAAFGLLGFYLALGYAGGETPRLLDREILLSLRHPDNLTQPLGPPWVQEAVRDFTALGSVSVLVFIVAAVVLYFLFSGRPGAALFVFLAVAGGQVMSSLLKLFIDRPRPDVVPHIAEVFTLSFPSGHAMLSAVTYLTLGAMLARVMPGRALKIYVMGLAVLLTVLVGLSRLYLGVHWPSDVLAGWCAGSAWAMLCWLLARLVLSRRRQGENPAESAKPQRTQER